MLLETGLQAPISIFEVFSPGTLTEIPKVDINRAKPPTGIDVRHRGKLRHESASIFKVDEKIHVFRITVIYVMRKQAKS